jgi:hypothetical protein
VTILLTATGCDKSLPDESDLPPEATLAYPGAVEVRRSFDDGEVGTYIDGGSADRSPRVELTYELDGVIRGELFDWYEGELLERGWIVRRRGSEFVGATRDPDGDLHFSIGVTAIVERFETYVVVLTVAYDE